MSEQKNNKVTQTAVQKPKHKYNKVTPITDNQVLYKRSLDNNILTVVKGMAGTGKTFLACVTGAELLEDPDSKIEQIILVRPYVDLNNRGIGYLKGGEFEKLQPYVQPMLDALKYVLGTELLNKYLEEGKIQVKALASIRGMSYNNSYIICDEMQATVPNEIQAVTTRIGKDTKIVIMGDTRQSDVKRSEDGLTYLVRIIEDYSIQKTGFIELGKNDIVRSGITRDFVLAYEDDGWK